MAFTSFRKPAAQAAAKTPEPPAPPAREVPAVIDDENIDLAVSRPTEGVHGEIDPSDIVIPTMKVIQKIDDLSEVFPPGTVVYNEDVRLTDGKTPIEVTVLSLTKFLEEKKEFGSDERARIFPNRKAALDAGCQDQDYESPGFVRPVARVIALISQPEGDKSGLFTHEHGGWNYALAVWTLRSSAYTSAGKALVTASVSHLRDGIWNGKWELTTQKRSNAQNTWHIPVLKSAGRHDVKFAAWAVGLLKY